MLRAASAKSVPAGTVTTTGSAPAAVDATTGPSGGAAARPPPTESSSARLTGWPTATPWPWGVYADFRFSGTSREDRGEASRNDRIPVSTGS
jgi:hypothetical protein